mgnify:CR=1 FL=1
MSVKTGAKEKKVVEAASGELLVWVKDRPVEGKANEAVIRALADHFGCAKSQVTIHSGHTSKHKIVDIGL